MNIQQLIPYCLLAGLLSFSACESEQAAEMNEAGTELPDGMYPLTFTAVQAEPEGTPQTRVSENPDGTSSKWDGDEVIGVKIGDNGKEGSYTLDENGNVTPPFLSIGKTQMNRLFTAGIRRKIPMCP